MLNNERINRPIVSICCATYNHEKYIRSALDGFLAQETDFPFEILIHDDASPDDTPNIIREYQEKYPQIIKPIFQKDNQYSQGKKAFAYFLLPEAAGKYIALCEGDDYWMDPHKLQKQVDFIEANKNCSMVAHAIQIENALDPKKYNVKRSVDGDHYFNQEELIMHGTRLIHTSSMLFRSSLVKNIPNWVTSSPIGDYPLILFASMHGRIYYINEVMSTYRSFVPGSAMSIKSKLSNDNLIDYCLRVVNMFQEFDAFSSFKYHRVIKRKISAYLYKQLRKVWKRSSISSFKIYLRLRKYFTIKEHKKIIKIIVPYANRFIN
ncbi:MAG: glycosyltransferase [Anaerolineaceae bacterium]|nr:glycosyltransferase [Anaerolineaceae bacterium]